MKITKKQLKQLIKEELLKETDWYDVEKETPPPLSKGVETAELDVEALKQVLQATLDEYDPDFNPHFDSVDDLKQTVFFTEDEEGLDCVLEMTSGPFSLDVGEETLFSFCKSC